MQIYSLIDEEKKPNHDRQNIFRKNSNAVPDCCNSFKLSMEMMANGVCFECQMQIQFDQFCVQFESTSKRHTCSWVWQFLERRRSITWCVSCWNFAMYKIQLLLLFQICFLFTYFVCRFFFSLSKIFVLWMPFCVCRGFVSVAWNLVQLRISMTHKLLQAIHSKQLKSNRP